MTTQKVQIEMELKDAFLAAVLCTAIEGAIEYWASVPKDSVVSREDDYVSAKIVESEASTDGEDPKEKTIGYAELADGIRKALLVNPLDPDIRASILQAVCEDDAGFIDAQAADVIVQMAVFGELVYG
jgi:hypothetical protein